MNSEYIYLLQATEEQYQKFMKFLDIVLKKDGVEKLQDVVDVYNVLASARKMPVFEEPDSQKETLDNTALSSPTPEE
jgi:hypothetical protein